MTDNQADAAAKQRDEATKKHAEDTKKKLAEERDARAERNSKAAKEGVAASKPTPTQEENDLHASGVPVTEHEDDGSGPDPNTPQQTKQSEANKPAAAKGGYQTRTATPARHE
jgi:hypothetical protein